MHLLAGFQRCSHRAAVLDLLPAAAAWFTQVAGAAYRKVESRFTWLESKDTPDGRGRRRGDPRFDERTVTVPETFYKQLSGAAAAAFDCLAR